MFTVSARADTSRLDEVLKTGKLRVCMTGDYKPFSFLKQDGSFAGMDVDLATAIAKSMGVEAHFVKTSWSKLMDDFLDKCDVAMGGVSVTLERLKRAGFADAHMVDGKSAIARCADLPKFSSWEAIDQPSTRAVTNPGGTNERFAKAHYKQAQLSVYPDNVTIFDQIVQGKADVMVTDTSETLWQAKQHPELCPVRPDQPLQYAEKAIMLPRGDTSFKAWIDAWLHLQKADGSFQQIADRWLK
jgi:cyclohexadienyl dehydratase